MSDYEKFLEELRTKDFWDFVKSGEVNLYLQTIGPYESERGRWATIYDDCLRFGDRTYRDRTYRDRTYYSPACERDQILRTKASSSSLLIRLMLY